MPGGFLGRGKQATEAAYAWLERAWARLEPRLGLIALGLSATITLLVYAPTLGFSYFHDDVYDLARTEDETYWSILRQPLPGNVYYRPGAYLLWKTVYLLTGEYNTVLLHAIPLACHIISGWLLFLLLHRITKSGWSLLPMALFLLYPFHYQALQIMGALFHPLVTMFILAALLLWYDGRVRDSPVRLALAVGCTVLALWTHEYGATIFPLLLVIEAGLWRHQRVLRPTAWLLAPLLANAIFLALWFSFERPQRDPTTASDAVHNAGFWLQGFAYPITRQVGWLTDLFGGDPLRLVLPVGALGILAALAAYYFTQRWSIAGAALIFGGLAFLPAIVGLTYEYVQSGPRLLYIVAPATAAFWGLLPMLPIGRGRWRTAWRAGTLTLLALVMVQSVLFIDRRTTMFEYGTEIADGVIDAALLEPERPTLVINTPAWFAVQEQEFPRGNLGIQVEADYFGLDQLVYIATGQRPPVESRSLAPNVSGWRYNFQPHGPPIDHAEIDAKLRAGANLYVVDLFHDDLAVRQPGEITPAQPPPPDQLATFNDTLQLLDCAMTRDGNLVTVTTRWYARETLPADYQIWTQLRDPNGPVIAERQDYALRGMSPPRLWQPGDLIEDRLVLDLLDANPDSLTAWITLVNTADGSLANFNVTADQPVESGWLRACTIE